MATLLSFPRISTVQRPAHLIRVAVPRLNKQDTIAAYLKQIPARDYDYDDDHIRVCSNHPLYAVVMEAYRAQELHDQKRLAKRGL